MRQVLLHAHIFKNAGSTLDWSLQRSFGNDWLDHRDDEVMIHDGPEHLVQLLAERKMLRALSSHHLCYPLPVLEDVLFTPLFMFRHPVSRMASAYAFERKQRVATPGARAARSMSFYDYICWRMQPEVSPALRNYQTCYLAGLHDRSQSQIVDHTVFSRAQTHLDCLVCIGVVERYDESAVCMEEYLRPLFPQLDLAYRVQNVTRDWGEPGLDGRVDAVLEKLGDQRSLVLQHNQYDLEIYKLANERLDSALAALEHSEEKLRAFRDRCRRLSS